MTEAIAGVEDLEIRIATQTQRRPREATETTHLEEGTGTWTGRLLREIRTASVIRTADTTDPDAHAAEALSTTTTAEQDCRTARRTFTRGRYSASDSEYVVQDGGRCYLAVAMSRGWHQVKL